MRDGTLEVCVDSLESAIEAKKGGADRLELCGNLIIGGTTPEYELFEQVKERSGLKIRVLIRPRFGDFLYSNEEVERMEKQIRTFESLGADGVVIGALTKDGDLDLEVMKRLMAAAGKMKVTLHRAFDVCKDPFLTLKEAEKLGVSTILTSGQEKNCMEGKKLITELLDQAGNKIEILVGGGVDEKVIKEFLKDTKAKAFHMSGKTVIKSQMRHRNTRVNMGMEGIDEYDIFRTDSSKVAKASALLHKN